MARRIDIAPTSVWALAALVGMCLLALAPTSAHAARLLDDRIGPMTVSVLGSAKTGAPDIGAPAGILAVAGGPVLWSRSADEVRQMASTTKIMTALVAIQSRRVDHVVTVADAATRTGYATGLRRGEQRTVRELLELMLVASSNDAATALAIDISGSVPAFAAEMNRRAGQLGMTETRFVNAHGLDEPGHHSSASDLALLMEAAMREHEFRRILPMRSVVLPAYGARKERLIDGTNKVHDTIAGLRGGKTGFTNKAKYCFVADAKLGDLQLVSVVLGSKTGAARFTDTKRLLDWGFAHYRMQTLMSADTSVGMVPVGRDERTWVTARTTESTATMLLDLAGPLTSEASLIESLSAPVYRGQELGTIRVKQGSRLLAVIPVAADRDVASTEETMGVLAVEQLEGTNLLVRTAPSSASVRAYDTSRPLDVSRVLPKTVSAPVSKGEQVGAVTYAQDGRVIVTVPIVATADIEAPGLLHRMREALSRVLGFFKRS